MPDANASVNVPAVGKVKRQWVVAGLAAVAGIVVVAYWRAARTPVEEPAQEGTEGVAGDEWSPDAYAGATAPGGASFIPGDTASDATPGTNVEWAQRVVDLLEGVGYDRNKAAATIGKYLAGQPLDGTEKLIVQAALALLGNPPAGALPIITAGSAPTQPGSPGPSGSPKPTTTPRGDRVNHTQPLETYARHFSKSTSADSVEATKRQILTLNPWLKARIYGPPGRPFPKPKLVQAGWILIVPRSLQR